MTRPLAAAAFAVVLVLLIAWIHAAGRAEKTMAEIVMGRSHRHIIEFAYWTPVAAWCLGLWRLIRYDRVRRVGLLVLWGWLTFKDPIASLRMAGRLMDEDDFR